MATMDLRCRSWGVERFVSCKVLTDMLLRLLGKEEENGYVPVKELM